jgi:hypothetical protein
MSWTRRRSWEALSPTVGGAALGRTWPPVQHGVDVAGRPGVALISTPAGLILDQLMQAIAQRRSAAIYRRAEEGLSRVRSAETTSTAYGQPAPGAGAG